MIHENQGLHQIAIQAHFLEQIGNIKGSYRLLKLLEEHNCCLICGTEQEFDPAYYQQTGIWKCPRCNGH